MDFIKYITEKLFIRGYIILLLNDSYSFTENDKSSFSINKKTINDIRFRDIFVNLVYNIEKGFYRKG